MRQPPSGPDAWVARARTGEVAEARWSAPWLRRYLLVLVPLDVAYLALPDPPRYLWTLIGLLSVAGLTVGILVNKPRHRLPWWLVTCGVAALMLGDATYDVLTEVAGADNPFPSAADALYLAMYPLTALGLLLLVRATNPLGDKPAAIDAGIVTVAVGLFAWVYLVEPYAGDSTLGWLEKAVSIGYPLGDILILAVLTRLLISGRHTRALWLLGLGTVGLLASDAVYGLDQLNGSWSTGGMVDTGWMVFYGAWGAAALSPDMREQTEPRRPVARPMSRARLTLLMTVPLIPPALLLWYIVRSTPTIPGNVPETAVAAAILFLLVSLRLKGLVEAAGHAAHRERAMRSTGDDLVATSDAETVYRVAVDAVRDIAGDRSRILVALGAPLRVVFDSAAESAPGAAAALQDLVRRHEPELRREQFVLTTGARCVAALGEDLDPDEVVLLAAMVRGDQFRGVLLVAGPGIDGTITIDPVCSLASQMILALDSIDLTAQVAERRGEAHFRSLFEHAADIIVVLDEDLRPRFATPSAESVLGWDVGATADRTLDSMVLARDQRRARQMLDRVLAAPAHSHPTEEWHIVDRDGIVRQFEVAGRNLVDDPDLGGIVVTLHDITERRKLESDLAYQAFHDSLTRLPNRAMFLDRVEQALSRTEGRGAPIAVILIDLDNFKVINDTRGHAAGDALLVHVAQRLRAVIRPMDACARLGGDEFAILVEGMSSDAEAHDLAARVIEHLRVPFEIGGETVSAGASIGVTTSSYGNHASELLLQADLAMYAAKDAGKGGAQFFLPAMIDLMQLRARTASELEHAAPRDEFVLHYQPIVSLETAQVVGFEALLRWEHPERGLLCPDSFIDIVEESDLALAVGAWVIEHAVAQAARWQPRTHRDGALKMSLNVTPREFAQPGFVETVVTALDRHSLAPGALVLEITERILADRDPQIIHAMSELQEHGVRLAVDDFGTGYAALGYLRRFPVSTLKIDRSFVDGLGRSLDDSALVEAIIGLGETFGLDLVAEGVESEQQRVELLRLGCQFAQGYYYSRPLPATDAETLVRGGGVLPQVPA